MIEVTCAIIRNDENEILVVQRGEASDHPFKWEFPGGKLNEGETDEECIIREVAEELSLEIIICGKLSAVEHDYGHKKVRLIPFICDTLDELPFLSEHIAFKWIQPAELKSVDFSEADIFVASSYLESVDSHMIDDVNTTSDSKQSITEDADLQSLINKMMSSKEAGWIAASAIENPAILQKLLEYSLSEEKRLAFRASWTLTKVCDKFPEIIYPHLSLLVEALDQLNNESTQRSFLRILSLTDLNKVSNRQEGILTDHCFRALRSGFSAIAVKVYSMEILYKLSVKYPELVNELSASVNMIQNEGSAALMSRGRMILRKLAAIPINPKSNLK